MSDIVDKLVNPAGSGPAVALCWEARKEITRLRDEVEKYEQSQSVLDQAINLLCDAMERDINDYDRDQSQEECYLDCFRDAAEIIKKSDIRFDPEDCEFRLKRKL